MVPNKFNIVDFGGFDLAEQYGGTIPGIYDKIVDAHWNCVYIMCFGLKFGGFDIAPQYMIPEMFSDHIMLNGIVSIDRNDVITVPSIEPPAPEPVILPATFEENGVYNPPSGVDGYAPVTVNVGGLPAGYQRVQYVQSNGGQYINTGVNSKSGLMIFADLSVDDFGSAWQLFFGGGIGNANDIIKIGIQTRANMTIQYGKAYKDFSPAPYLDLNTRATVLALNKGILINGMLFQGAATMSGSGTSDYGYTFSTSIPIYLFASNEADDGTPVGMNVSRIKLYEAAIFDTSILNIIHHYIPCVRLEDNIAGLYDIIDGAFLRSAGPNDFVISGDDST